MHEKVQKDAFFALCSLVIKKMVVNRDYIYFRLERSNDFLVRDRLLILLPLSSRPLEAKSNRPHMVWSVLPSHLSKEEKRPTAVLWRMRKVPSKTFVCGRLESPPAGQRPPPQSTPPFGHGRGAKARSWRRSRRREEEEEAD